MFWEKISPASFDTNPKSQSSPVRDMILFLFQGSFKKNCVSLAFPELLHAQFLFYRIGHCLMSFTCLSLAVWRRTLLNAGEWSWCAHDPELSPCQSGNGLLGEMEKGIQGLVGWGEVMRARVRALTHKCQLLALLPKEFWQLWTSPTTNTRLLSFLAWFDS